MENYKLPMDLVVEILARLPVKSLMRFKCVCKYFYDLIESDHQFIHKHYEIRKAKSDCVFLEMGSNVREYYLLYKESGCNEIGCIYLDIPSRPIQWVKCCQGMLCMISSKTDRTQLDGVDYLSYDVLIWNPSIRKIKALPPITFPNTLPKGASVTTEFGFGISNNMTWKVVILLEIRDNLGLGGRSVPQQITMVYSQVCGDLWDLKQSDSVPSFPPLQGQGYDFYLKGRYYWRANDYYSNQPFSEEFMFDIDYDIDYFETYIKNFKQHLLWFDMDNEVFGTIELPRDEDINIASVTIMNESIALLCSCTGISNCVEVWLMIENGNNIHWRVEACVINIDNNNGCCRPIGIWNLDGQLLVLPDGIICWYRNQRDIPYFLSIDLETQEMKEVLYK